MQCPYCSLGETRVVDTREVDEEATRRRRECESCAKRFTTYERIESVDLTVLKKDGSTEPFSRDKVKAGITKACEKRPITDEQVDAIVNQIERTLRRRKSTEVRSTDIGDIVMKKLKKLDEVAYIRFASVYQSFESAKAFEKQLAALKT